MAMNAAAVLVFFVPADFIWRPTRMQVSVKKEESG